MKNLIKYSLIVLTVILGSCAAIAEECNYMDLEKNVTLSSDNSYGRHDGKGLLTSNKINNHFTYILHIGNNKIYIEILDSQSGMHRVNINGKLGMAFEVTRNHWQGATLDLKRSFEWNFDKQ